MTSRKIYYRTIVNKFLEELSHYDEFQMVDRAYKALQDNEKTEYDFNVFMLCQLVEHFRNFCQCFYDKNQLIEHLQIYKSLRSTDLEQIFNQVDFSKINPTPGQVNELSETLSNIFENDWKQYNDYLISFKLPELPEVVVSIEEVGLADWVVLA